MSSSLIIVNQIIKFVHIKLLLQWFSFINLYFQSTIVKVILILVQQPFLLVQPIGIITVDVKFKSMLHPSIIRLQLISELGQPIVETVFNLRLVRLLHEFISHSLGVGKQSYFLVEQHLSLAFITPFFDLLKIQFLTLQVFKLLSLQFSHSLQLFFLFIPFTLASLFGHFWQTPHDFILLGARIEYCPIIQYLILNQSLRWFLIQLALLLQFLQSYDFTILSLFMVIFQNLVLELFCPLLFFFSLFLLFDQIICFDSQLVRQRLVLQQVMR